MYKRDPATRFQSSLQDQVWDPLGMLCTVSLMPPGRGTCHLRVLLGSPFPLALLYTHLRYIPCPTVGDIETGQAQGAAG